MNNPIGRIMEVRTLLDTMPKGQLFLITHSPGVLGIVNYYFVDLYTKEIYCKVCDNLSDYTKDKWYRLDYIIEE